MHSGGESSAEVLALRALVQEQSARIAELERQLAEAKATADVPVLLQSWNTRVQHALRLSEEQLSTGLRALDDALLSTEPFFDELSRPDPYLSNAGRRGNGKKSPASSGDGSSSGGLLMSTLLDDVPMEEDEEEEDNDDGSGSHASDQEELLQNMDVNVNVESDIVSTRSEHSGVSSLILG